MKKLILSIVTILFGAIIIAQTPQSFKYQAVARDNAGEIINNQLVSFRISILQGSATGTSMYSETHQLTTNDFGLANLEIGTGTFVSGNFITIDWSSGSYFLKVELDATGGLSYQLMGTSQLLSVPYALFAEKTANPGDNDWTISGDDMYSEVAGNVGIGTIYPSAKLEVAGRINQSFTGNSIFIGYQSGFNDDLTSNHNVFIGYTSGYYNISGSANVGLGTNSLFHTTSGNNNSALGFGAVSSNTTGSGNTGIGSNALKNNESGDNNTAIGYQAGFSTTFGGGVYLGYQAGYNNNAANKLYIENSDSDLPLIYGEFDNDIVGINGHLGVGTMTPSSTLDVAGHISQSGIGESVFVGNGAGQNDNLNNNYNTFIGSEAGFSNTVGSWNTAVGRASLHNNTYGEGNVAIGGGALVYNQTGDYNTIIGASAGSGATDINGCVFIGHNAGSEEYSDNTLHIGNSYSPLIYGEFDNDIVGVNGSLGIGTESPLVRAHIVGGTDASLAGGGYLVAGTTTGENLVFDENEIMARLNGAANTLHLQRDGGSLTLHYGLTPTSQVYINSSGWTGIGTNAPNTKLNVNTATGENAFRVQTNYSTKLLVTSSGAVVVGYNNSSPTFALQLQNSSTDMLGRGLAYSWTIYSDDRLKSNQKQLEYGLKEVMQLQPKSYNHHSSDVNEEGIVAFAGSQKVPTIGFIAQEVQQIIPEAVYEPADDSKNLWGMDYEKLIPVLTKAIQEQQQMIEEMKLEIETLKNQ